MARTKDVILTPEQKEQMEKEYFEALKPLESVNATPSSTIPKKRIGDKQRKETLEKNQASFKFRESTTASLSSSVLMFETVLTE